jgi:hypothetical protein
MGKAISNRAHQIAAFCFFIFSGYSFNSAEADGFLFLLMRRISQNSAEYIILAFSPVDKL